MTQDKMIASVLLAGLVAILITPLCGYLFQCGCDWPWLGLDKGCNYWQSHSVHKCPWCVSMPAAVLSAGIAFLAAVGVMLTIPLNFTLKVKAAAIRLWLGLAVFLVIASLGGMMAAYAQHYPFGVGRYWY